MSWAGVDIAVFLVGAVAEVVGLPLLIWAVLWDWSRGRARCQRCWHSMVGIPAADDGSFTCPECGRVMPKERSLFRRRVRYRVALAATILLTSGAGGIAWPFVRSTSWVQHVPTPALVWLMPHMEARPARLSPVIALNYKPSPGELLLGELTRRVDANAISPSVMSSIRARAIEILEGRSADPDITLKESQNDPLWTFVEMRQSPGFIGEDLRDLIAVRAERSIHVRAAWPDDIRPRAYFEVGRILPWWRNVDVIALARLPEARQVSFRFDEDRYAWGDYWMDGTRPFGMPEPEANEVVFDVLVTGVDSQGNPVVAWTGEVKRPFEWRTDRCISPLEGRESKRYEATIREALELAIISRQSLRSSLDLDMSAHTDPDVAIALRMTMVLGGHDLWTTWIWHCPIEGRTMLDGSHAVQLRQQYYEHDGGPQWMLRVEGDAELALRHPTATRYWDGSFEIPLVMAEETTR